MTPRDSSIALNAKEYYGPLAPPVVHGGALSSPHRDGGYRLGARIEENSIGRFSTISGATGTHDGYNLQTNAHLRLTERLQPSH